MARSETRIKWSIWQTILCALCNGRKGARVE